MIISDIYIPSISHGGPPSRLRAEGQSDQFNGRLTFTCQNLAELRAIGHNPQNLKATLLGEITAFDGLLQGEYYWVESNDADDGATTIRGTDYHGYLWKKLN